MTMYDVKREFLSNSLNSIRKSLYSITEKKNLNSQESKDFVDKVLSKISIATSPDLPVQDADLVIEAIVENADIKKELFNQIDRNAPEKSIFTSNTSSLSIADIAGSTGRPDRFAGLHFFNPVPIMKLVEIVKTDKTSENTFKILNDFIKSLGKTVVTCKDTPGFIVNRLLVPYLIEAIRLHEAGVASTKDIDTAMKLGAGYPMGPFELLDYVGLDTVKFILDAWHKSHPNEPLFAPSKSLNELVEQGNLGKKSGKGFYSYENAKSNL